MKCTIATSVKHKIELEKLCTSHYELGWQLYQEPVIMALKTSLHVPVPSTSFIARTLTPLCTKTCKSHVLLTLGEWHYVGELSFKATPIKLYVSGQL